MLLCYLRRTLKPSASATVISKLYQHFRVRDHPYGLQDSLPTLNPSCSLLKIRQPRHGSKARYGWVANPYRNPLLNPSRQGLSPCKIRRALLGAITCRVRGAWSEAKSVTCTRLLFYDYSVLSFFEMPVMALRFKLEMTSGQASRPERDSRMKARKRSIP